MGTSSKGRIVTITKRKSKEHDIFEQPTYETERVRTTGSGKVKNCPTEYDSSKMKTTSRSKRGVK